MSKHIRLPGNYAVQISKIFDVIVYNGTKNKSPGVKIELTNGQSIFYATLTAKQARKKFEIIIEEIGL